MGYWIIVVGSWGFAPGQMEASPIYSRKLPIFLVLISLLFIAEALGKLFERGIRKTHDKKNRLFQKHLSFFGLRSYICS